MVRRRMHSRELNPELVQQVATGEKRPARVCREHRMAGSLLLPWHKGVEARGEADFALTAATGPWL